MSSRMVQSPRSGSTVSHPSNVHRPRVGMGSTVGPSSTGRGLRGNVACGAVSTALPHAVASRLVTSNAPDLQDCASARRSSSGTCIRKGNNAVSHAVSSKQRISSQPLGNVIVDSSSGTRNPVMTNVTRSPQQRQSASRAVGAESQFDGHTFESACANARSSSPLSAPRRPITTTTIGECMAIPHASPIIANAARFASTVAIAQSGLRVQTAAGRQGSTSPPPPVSRRRQLP